MEFQASGEWGDEIVESDTIEDAAYSVAKSHAGLECDEICRDPFWFTMSLVGTPDCVRQFQAEWNPEDGLLVLEHYRS